MAVFYARILCVGEDPAIREYLVSQLQRLGIFPVVTSSGREALRIARSEPVHVCVLNSRMSDMDGSRLAGELRSCSPEIPLVLVSREGSVAQAVLRRVDRFVAKEPGFERRLVSEVISLLGWRSRAASA